MQVFQEAISDVALRAGWSVSRNVTFAKRGDEVTVDLICRSHGRQIGFMLKDKCSPVSSVSYYDRASALLKEFGISVVWVTWVSSMSSLYRSLDVAEFLYIMPSEDGFSATKSECVEACASGVTSLFGLAVDSVESWSRGLDNVSQLSRESAAWFSETSTFFSSRIERLDRYGKQMAKLIRSGEVVTDLEDLSLYSSVEWVQCLHAPFIESIRSVLASGGSVYSHSWRRQKTKIIEMDSVYSAHLTKVMGELNALIAEWKPKMLVKVRAELSRLLDEDVGLVQERLDTIGDFFGEPILTESQRSRLHDVLGNALELPSDEEVAEAVVGILPSEFPNVLRDRYGVSDVAKAREVFRRLVNDCLLAYVDAETPLALPAEDEDDGWVDHEYETTGPSLHPHAKHRLEQQLEYIDYCLTLGDHGIEEAEAKRRRTVVEKEAEEYSADLEAHPSSHSHLWK